MPDSLADSIEYNPGVVLDEDGWFRIADFVRKPYCLPLLQEESFSSVNYDAIRTGDFGNIVFLCGYQNNDYFFQRVTPARQVKKKRLIFGDQCEFQESSATISINDYADAIYSPSKDELFFRRLRDISAIFAGISELYREATEEEVKDFLSYNFIELGENYTSDNVKINNRRRIATALETLRHFTKVEQKTVFDYIKDYCPELTVTNNKFIINDENNLKLLLYGIEQRYYTTPVGEERRFANSVIPLNQHGG